MEKENELLKHSCLVSDLCDMFWCIEINCDSYNTGYKCKYCEKNGRCDYCILQGSYSVRRPESCIELERGLVYGEWSFDN